MEYKRTIHMFLIDNCYYTIEDYLLDDIDKRVCEE